MTPETIAHVQKVVAEHGCDAWWTFPTEDLLPPSLASLAPKLTRGRDTMDVWFDSGTSWAGVLNTREGLAYPADVYLEGSDQIRGWFCSSLATSVAVNGHAPYKNILMHGFVLDGKGNKMSKSLGNVVDPMEVINGGKSAPGYGADVLRVWAATSGYFDDV